MMGKFLLALSHDHWAIPNIQVTEGWAICLSSVEAEPQKIYNTLRQASQQLGRNGGSE
jgi:hypothetical protein